MPVVPNLWTRGFLLVTFVDSSIFCFSSICLPDGQDLVQGRSLLLVLVNYGKYKKSEVLNQVVTVQARIKRTKTYA